MRQLLEGDPELRVCIIGDGPQRLELEALVQDEPRIEFAGNLDALDVRAYLRKTKVFVSGCETEALGLAYVEALSQGCAVAMPACGGGLEIAPELIGSRILLLSLSLEEKGTVSGLKRLLKSNTNNARLAGTDNYDPECVADRYLNVACGNVNA
jgi:glycosyltransferase involved in cell wall biosynthesis